MLELLKFIFNDGITFFKTILLILVITECFCYTVETVKKR